MPLLPLETSLFPEDLLAHALPEQADGPECWWALHTHPRAEKTLARHFLRRGLAFFLPLYQRQWSNRGRQFRSHVPLFPGYLFLYGDGQARVAALETNQVTNVLPVVDQARLHADLARVHRLIQSGSALTPEGGLLPGTRVAIVQGPLAGLEGKVLRQGKQLRFLIEVEFLQRGVSVEVDSRTLQPLSTEETTPCAG